MKKRDKSLQLAELRRVLDENILRCEQWQVYPDLGGQFFGVSTPLGAELPLAKPGNSEAHRTASL